LGGCCEVAAPEFDRNNKISVGMMVQIEDHNAATTAISSRQT